MSHMIEAAPNPNRVVAFAEYSVMFAVALVAIVGLLRIVGVLG
jgi:hypothetical protein